jgi:hypothetical protein
VLLGLTPSWTRCPSMSDFVIEGLEQSASQRSAVLDRLAVVEADGDSPNGLSRPG